MLVIDFEIGDADGVRDVWRYASFDALKKVFASPWDETWLLVCTHHGIGFARAGLTIGEDACVVSLEVVVQKFLAERIVDVFLVGIMRIGRFV